MKNLELRSSLIKSGVLLVLFIFFIYAFAVGDSGGIGGTIGSLISGIVFIIGLSVALVFSIMIILGIYFGILYLYDPAVSKKTYNEFIAICTVATSTSPLSVKCCSSKKAPPTPPSTPAVSLADIQLIESNQAKLGDQLNTIESTIETLQNSINDFSNAINAAKEEISSLEASIETKATAEAIDEASKKLSGELAGIKDSIQPLNDKLSTLEADVTALAPQDDKAGEDVQGMIDLAVDALKTDIKTIQSDMSKLSLTADNEDITEASNTTDNSPHRMLSYFSKKADEKKFVASVKKAVDQGMTYAQVGEFLEDALSKDAGEVISEHPSLTKDYIRSIRQKE